MKTPRRNLFQFFLTVSATLTAGFYFNFIIPLRRSIAVQNNNSEGSGIGEYPSLQGRRTELPEVNLPAPSHLNPTSLATNEIPPSTTSPNLSNAESRLDAALETLYPMPEILPLLSFVDGWRNVPANAYPKEVVANQPIAFHLLINGKTVGSSNVATGTPLKPVRLVDDQLTVASTMNPTMTTTIPVEHTDFKEQIEARYQQFLNNQRLDIEAKRARARQIISAEPARLTELFDMAGRAAAVPNGDR